jgi:Caudovirus prohead serine protease
MNNTAINIVTREAVIRALSEENIKNREAEFVISTEAVDTYGTVFKIDGWELERYANNPIVVYGHKIYSDNPDMIIGTSQLRIEGKELIAKAKFEDESVNPMAEKVWRKVQAGTLRMASISGNPKEYRWGDKEKGEDPKVLYFTRTELMEWSIVPVASNPEALKRSVETIEEIRKSLEPKAPIVEREDKGLSLFEAQSLINNNLI